MSIVPVLSDKACAFPANLFHHAKIFNSVVYTTGQIGGDVSGMLVSPDIRDQAKQMFDNLPAILAASNSTLERVLSANIYLTDVEDYAAFNEEYTKASLIPPRSEASRIADSSEKLMPDPKPPRTCVFVKALPAGALCEMSLTAAIV